MIILNQNNVKEIKTRRKPNISYFWTELAYLFPSFLIKVLLSELLLALSELMHLSVPGMVIRNIHLIFDIALLHFPLQISNQVS